MKTILTMLLIFMIFPVILFPLELSRLVLTRDIKNSEPADSDTVFFLVEEAVYCFTEFENVREACKVVHKWFCNGQLITSIVLTLQPARRWRTWSKKIFKNCTGEWMVQVCDNRGKIFAEQKFQVKQM